MYHKAEHYRADRLQRLRGLLQEEGLDGIVLFGRENTQYYSGFTGTESWVLITAEEAFIVLDSRYTEQGERQCAGFDILPTASASRNVLFEKMNALKLQNVGLEGDFLPWTYVLELQENFPQVHFKSLQASLAQLRVLKDPSEIQAIRKAVEIADEAFRMLLPTIRPGQTENQIAAQLEFNMRSLGASKPSFTTIMASGYRGAMPHGVASDKRVEVGEAITMDFGALYEGYCSDITRTIFLGKADPRIVEIYNIVLEAQLAGESILKAGVTGKSVDAACRDIITAKGYGQYFGHGTGHSLGLEIHETPYANGRYDKPLPAGCLMTVEPGIYIPGVGGVRIEDTVLVKEDGCEVLTQADKSLIILPV